ncbi:MAG: GNAT family N-acetyltransferase [Saccharofermentans sp.]|nr:GNAT family N-acetyltransferase [Saccharofermentans sp.]
MKLISDYMRDENSRHMLNALTRKTFGFDFEGWVTNGYFEGDYIPYSLVENGVMISNVSANKMRFVQNGVIKNYIQLGTVMTDESYRNQGLAAKLMQHVIKEYEDKCDGIYLFGDLSAMGFYRKMGFDIVNQYMYFVKEEFCNSGKSGGPFMPVSEMDEDIKKKYKELVRLSYPHSAFEQMNKFGLQMFYTSGMDSVYYSSDLDCFIVKEQDGDTVLGSVLCRKKVRLAEVLKRINVGNRLRLGFVPLGEDKELCDCSLYDGADDYRLFYRGSELEAIERDKLYFPDLSHA